MTAHAPNGPQGGGLSKRIRGLFNRIGGLWSRIQPHVASVLTGVLATLLAAVILVLMQDKWLDSLAESLKSPTCSNPRDLQPVPPSAITASADPLRESFAADNVLDQDGGSLWIPPLVRPADRTKDQTNSRRVAVFEDSNSVLKLTFGSEHDIKLVCLTNGITRSFGTYVNWGRVRTIEVSTTDHSDERTILESMPEGGFQNLQIGAHDLGKTNEVQIKLIDVYTGQTVESHDPDECGAPPRGYYRDGNLTRDPDGSSSQVELNTGCIIAPTAKAGVSEVVLYEPGS